MLAQRGVFPQKEVKVEAQGEQRSIRSVGFSTLNLDLSLTFRWDARSGRSISPLLMYAAKTSVPETSTKSDSPGIVILPEKSLQLGMALLPGTHPYICQRKGHTNMTEALIVE